MRKDNKAIIFWATFLVLGLAIMFILSSCSASKLTPERDKKEATAGIKVPEK